MRAVKKLALTLCFGIAAIGLSMQAVSATPINGAATGLVSPTISHDFEAGALPVSTVVTTQFAGVTFGTNYNLFDNGGTNNANITGRFLGDVGSVGPGSIFFIEDVTAASFNLRTNATTTTFTALLDSVIVDSFAAATDLSNTSNFFGFEGIVFDEIQISIASGGYNLDNLEFITLPEPSAIVLLGLGLIGLGAMRRRKAA